MVWTWAPLCRSQDDRPCRGVRCRRCGHGRESAVGPHRHRGTAVDDQTRHDAASGLRATRPHDDICGRAQCRRRRVFVRPVGHDPASGRGDRRERCRVRGVSGSVDGTGEGCHRVDARCATVRDEYQVPLRSPRKADPQPSCRHRWRRRPSATRASWLRTSRACRAAATPSRRWARRWSSSYSCRRRAAIRRRERPRPVSRSSDSLSSRWPSPDPRTRCREVLPRLTRAGRPHRSRRRCRSP